MVLADLAVSIQVKLTSDSQRFAYFCLSSVGNPWARMPETIQFLMMKENLDAKN